MLDQIPPTIEVDKPWDSFEQYTHNMLSTVKIITVQPRAALSLQYHHSRDELWVVLDAGAKVELDERVIHPQGGDRIFIPRMTTHRLSAADVPVRILEVSFGEFHEEDIVRLEDVYGRAPAQGDSIRI
jgi:mannose-6-phosphate isomerase